MPDPITRIVFRKGNFSEKTNLVLLQGEPGYTIDAKRLFIGDGTTAGGIAVGMKNLGVATFGETTTNLSFDQINMRGQPGDIIYDTVTSSVFALTGSNPGLVADYARFGVTLAPDNVTITKVGNAFSVKQNSLDGTYFNTTAIGRGLERVSSDQVVQIPDPTGGLTFVGNSLSVATAGVDNTKLANMPANTIKARFNTVGMPTDVPIIQLAQSLAPIVNANVAAVPTGTILDFAGTIAPVGYLICDGTAVSRAAFMNLFNVIGTTWGAGDGTSTFNVPDLRRRVTVGSGGTGSVTLGSAVGQTGGVESVLLTANQSGLRSHAHNFAVTTTLQNTVNIPLNHQHYFGYGGGGDDGAFAVRAAPGANVNRVTTVPAGLWLGAERQQAINGDGGGGYQNRNWNAGVSIARMYVTSEVITDGHSPTAFTLTFPLNFTSTTSNIGESSANEAHTNIQPSAVVTKIIKT